MGPKSGSWKYKPNVSVLIEAKKKLNDKQANGMTIAPNQNKETMLAAA